MRQITNFFITGLPRSRTAWLAAFLSYGPVFCWHDALARCSKASDLWHDFNAVARHDENVRFVGDSDSALLMIADELNHICPIGKWIQIIRPMQEVFESWKTYFADDKYPGAPRTDDGVRSMLLAAQSMATALPGKIQRERYMAVDFADLEKRETLESVWAFITGGERFPQERWDLFNSLRINVIPDKIQLRWQSKAA